MWVGCGLGGLGGLDVGWVWVECWLSVGWMG